MKGMGYDSIVTETGTCRRRGRQTDKPNWRIAKAKGGKWMKSEGGGEQNIDTPKENEVEMTRRIGEVKPGRRMTYETSARHRYRMRYRVKRDDEGNKVKVGIAIGGKKGSNGRLRGDNMSMSMMMFVSNRINTVATSGAERWCKMTARCVCSKDGLCSTQGTFYMEGRVQQMETWEEDDGQVDAATKTRTLLIEGPPCASHRRMDCSRWQA